MISSNFSGLKENGNKFSRGNLVREDFSKLVGSKSIYLANLWNRPLYP